MTAKEQAEQTLGAILAGSILEDLDMRPLIRLHEMLAASERFEVRLPDEPGHWNEWQAVITRRPMIQRGEEPLPDCWLVLKRCLWRMEPSAALSSSGEWVPVETMQGFSADYFPEECRFPDAYAAWEALRGVLALGEKGSNSCRAISSG